MIKSKNVYLSNGTLLVLLYTVFFELWIFDKKLLKIKKLTLRMEWNRIITFQHTDSLNSSGLLKKCCNFFYFKWKTTMFFNKKNQIKYYNNIKTLHQNYLYTWEQMVEEILIFLRFLVILLTVDWRRRSDYVKNLLSWSVFMFL